MLLKAEIFSTPLGSCIAAGDEKALYALEFVEKEQAASHLQKLGKDLRCKVEFGKTGPIQSIQSELSKYFQDPRHSFQTPLQMEGTDFQVRVWNALLQIPPGKTVSYKEVAGKVGCDGFQAIGRANGSNRIAIVIPCHRVICIDGSLGGYKAGLDRKKWLLTHEK